MRALARRVWTSFGVGVQLLANFEDEEKIVLFQKLNQFCYKVLVSRVQLKIEGRVTRQKFLFTRYTCQGETNIICYSKKHGIRPRKCAESMSYWLSVQIGEDQIF